MLAVQQSRPLRLSVEQRQQTMNQSLPSLSELQEGTGLGRYSIESRGGRASDRTIAQGLRTPPLEMDVNPLLAPNYGPLQYKGVSVVASNNSSYPSNQAGISNTTYTSRAPLRETNQATHRPHNSVSNNEVNVPRAQASRRRNSEGNEIVHYLQIPRSINDSKGSLAEFAAQITCLFWFESSATLQFVEESRTGFEPTEPLLPEAMPTPGFRKWVTTILSTTQVTQNVILLALMFIHRLKRLNPGVKGKLGSEFRLLTVALMLGNKFLDDNTYTNKTWAEVSGISVQEIHIMEVEFLSNMRYTLYVSDKEWEAWHVKLSRFWNYFAKASKKPAENGSRGGQGTEASSFNVSSNLPSPPGSNHTSPPYTTSRSFGHAALPHPLSVPPYLLPSASSPITQLPAVDGRYSARKRSREDDLYEPPAKRPNLPPSMPSASSSTTATPSTIRGNNIPAPRLPMPNLSISTGAQPSSYSSTHGTQLPAPNRCSNGQSSSASRWPSSNQLPSLPQPSPFALPSSVNFTGNGDWQSRQSPYGVSSATPSPTSYHFPQSQHTPTHLSPSGFPIPRHSPYKPVRSVNTLLVPPPSASLHDPPQNLNYDQMHYQPLGRPVSERRSGTLPYVHPDDWAQAAPSQPFFLPQPTHYPINQEGSQSRIR